MLLLVRRFFGHRGGVMIWSIIVFAAFLSLASVGLLACQHGVGGTERAYMGTGTKAFEPMLGALASLITSREGIRQWCTRYARVLFWGGALSMAGLFIVLDGPSDFYFRGGAFFFSVGALLLIVGVRYGLHSPESRVLALAPISYLGRIS